MGMSRVQRFGILAAIAVFSLFLLTFRASSRSERPLEVPESAVDSDSTTGNARQPFPPGKAKDPSETYTKTIVMAKMSYDDVDWVYKLEGFNTSFYSMDDPMALHTVPKNKGREAMAYLTYIIENYESLPDIAIFFHPHASAWHNNILLDLDSAKTITRINPAHVMRQGYFNSRCHHDPGCPNWLHPNRPPSEYDMVKKKEEQYFTEAVWRELHPNDPVPYAISQPCCAQFAVSGERIRARPKSEYEHYRKWLLNTSISDEFSGRVLEYSWQFIFTGESEFCPSQHKCYCDGYGICFGGTTDDNFLGWLNTLRQREVIDDRLSELKKDRAKNEGKIKELEATKAVKVETIERLKREAYQRGESPKNRAEECERPWKEGDGF